MVFEQEVNIRSGKLKRALRETHSEIEQLSDSIALKASATDVYTKQQTQAILEVKANKDTLISEINASADRVKISADRINITGVITAGSIARSSDIPSNLSDLNNDEGFVTSSEVPSKVSDLTNDMDFATTSDIPTAVSDLTNDLNFASTGDIPTKVSQLTNDRSYQTPSEVNTAITSKGYATTTQAQGYADIAEQNAKDAIPTNVSELTNDSGFQNSTQVENAITSKGYQTASQVSSAITNGITGKADKADAVSEEQYIYISKVSGTISVDGTTSWVTETGDKQNRWTRKRPTYSTSYPVLFTAKQKKTVSGTVTCTTPIKDDTLTIIDGGHITTGTIDASVVNVTNIKASEIKSGKIQASQINAEGLTIGQSQVSGLTTALNGKQPTGDYATKTQAQGYATTAEQNAIDAIPTNVSELTNDSGFQNSSQVESAITSKGYQTASQVSSAITNGITGKADKVDAVSEEQYIYISKISGTISVDGTTSWVTETGDRQNRWTRKRPTYDTEYPVLFIAKQRKTVSGTVTCSTPIKDDTLTIIDGGHITTGTIDASVVNVTNIKASEIKSGKIQADQINTANLHVSAANVDGKLTASQINAEGLTIGQSQVSGLTTALSGKANTGDVPTKVSDLTNDSGFQNASQVSGAITSGISGKADKSEVPTKVSQLTNDSSFQTQSQVNAAKQEAINTASTDATNKANVAARTATSYLTQIDGTTGISVHDEGDTSNFSNVSSDGMKVYKGGTQYAHFSNDVILGETEHPTFTIINDDTMYFLQKYFTEEFIVSNGNTVSKDYYTKFDVYNISSIRIYIFEASLQASGGSKYGYETLTPSTTSKTTSFGSHTLSYSQIGKKVTISVKNNNSSYKATIFRIDVNYSSQTNGLSKVRCGSSPKDSNEYAFAVGNGIPSNPSNSLSVDWLGNLPQQMSVARLSANNVLFDWGNFNETLDCDDGMAFGECFEFYGGYSTSPGIVSTPDFEIKILKSGYYFVNVEHVWSAVSNVDRVKGLGIYRRNGQLLPTQTGLMAYGRGDSWNTINSSFLVYLYENDYIGLIGRDEGVGSTMFLGQAILRPAWFI